MDNLRPWTRDVNSVESRLPDGHKLFVIDTPGTGNPNRGDSDELELVRQLKGAFDIAGETVDTILICMQSEHRFSKDVAKPIQILKDHLEVHPNHIAVVFTACGERDEAKEIEKREDFLHKLQVGTSFPEDLRNLMREVGYRCSLLETKPKPTESPDDITKYYDRKVKEMLNLSKQTKPYTNKEFQERVRKLEEESRRWWKVVDGVVNTGSVASVGVLGIAGTALGGATFVGAPIVVVGAVGVAIYNIIRGKGWVGPSSKP